MLPVVQPSVPAQGSSIFDVAREAGVSRATAARALGGYGSVSDEARQRVEAAAERLGYSVNSVARSMVTGQTMTLGALIADVSNPFFARVIRGFTDGAREAGYDVVLVNTDETVDTEVHGLKLLTEKRVDGILVAPASEEVGEHLVTAVERGQALVQVDRFVPGLDTDVVVVDNYESGYRAVQRVITAGHTRIAAPILRTKGPDGRANLISTMLERHQGYRDAMAEAGLAVPAAYTPGAHGRAEVRTVTTEMLSRPDRPTAVFGLDDSFTLGIIDAVYACDLEVPEQVSIFGFDDTEWTTVVRPPLSVIAQPAYDLGACAAQALLRRIQTPDDPRRTHVLPTTWIERGSIRNLAG
jgi:LacI family transcriptional regulator